MLLHSCLLSWIERRVVGANDILKEIRDVAGSTDEMIVVEEKRTSDSSINPEAIGESMIISCTAILQIHQLRLLADVAGHFLPIVQLTLKQEIAAPVVVAVEFRSP